jgi:asparagine synthase (glutamine-hydrolysing)
VRHLYEGAVHVERHLEYARKSAYNNHLVSEAFGLFLAGCALPEVPRARRWAELGERILSEQASRQVYPDGGYLMHSHNYERAALQPYLLAAAVQRSRGRDVPASWLAAMARGLDFLVAHQNPADGRLSNSGSNDGALPAVLSSCDYSDFRPLLQALSLECRGERIYPPGAWDEEAAWLLGAAALDAPLRAPRRTSVSFPYSGSHVLRGGESGTFATFRCGTLRDRFAQIDMLHLDVFWRGENVLVDGGTYLYNGPERWLRHFTGSASHNTVTVDGRDQMVHHRRFKLIYLTRARLLRFERAAAYVLAEGEHHGFRREVGGAVHRRSVLFVPDALWVVVDEVSGTRPMSARLHWLAGPYESRYDGDRGRLTIDTPAGPFSVTVVDDAARPIAGDVVRGREDPPRGWYSRYYAEKVPVPSLAVVREAAPPIVFVSVLGGGQPRVERSGDRWAVATQGRVVRFTIREGRFDSVHVGDEEAK